MNRLQNNFFGIYGHVTKLFRGTERPPPLYFSMRRGAPFIFNSRMQWIALMNSRRRGRSAIPQVVHLMPANDSLVSSIEVIDVEVSDQHRSVHYMTVAKSGHGDVLEIEPETASTSDIDIYKGRKAALLNALAGRLHGERRNTPFRHADALSPERKSIAVPAQNLDDSIPSKPDASVTDFFFIIHGIRDTGSWAKRIGRELRRQAGQHRNRPRNIRTDTQSYGYFTAFPFLFPWIRRQKVEWLMDRYATYRALYPRARFSYIGHSNGTYLAASALRDYACCRFENVVFAGSVVRHDFDWKSLLDNNKPRKVARVMNYVATNDLIVSCLSDGLRKVLRTLDLGGAGHLGFDKNDNVHNINWVVGSHGAGIAEHTWETTARFALQGVVPQVLPYGATTYAKQQADAVKFGNFLAPFALIFAAALAIYLGWNLLHGLLGLPVLAAGTGWEQEIWDGFAAWPKPAQAGLALVFYWGTWFGLFRA